MWKRYLEKRTGTRNVTTTEKAVSFLVASIRAIEIFFCEISNYSAQSLALFCSNRPVR